MYRQRDIESMKAHGIQFLSGASILATWIFVPKFAQDHGASDFQIGIIFIGYGIAIFISSITFGRMSDILGRRPFLLAGLLASALCFALQGLATDLYTLFVFRALAGFSAGVFPASLVAYVHEAKRKMGRFSSAGALGWGLGVLGAGIVAQVADLKVIAGGVELDISAVLDEHARAAVADVEAGHARAITNAEVAVVHLVKARAVPLAADAERTDIRPTGSGSPCTSKENYYAVRI